MPINPKASAESASHATAHVVPSHRPNFKSLLAGNPNYFGTAAQTEFPVVLPLANDTTYEELDCVSYNPDGSVLEATISVKLAAGYGGDLCSNGSREYIRFFLDYGNGWVDGGVTSVEVHDIPNAVDCFDDQRLPLSYTATAAIDPERSWCHFPVLPRVRAILSWQVIPTGPDFVPVWGNVVECAVQIKPRPPWVIDLVGELSAIAKTQIELPPDFAYAGPLPLPGPGPVELGLAELAAMYAAPESGAESKTSAQIVPAHRFGFTQLASVAASAAVGPEMVAQQIATWSAVGLNWQEAIAAINDVDADVSYEELDCIGLDNNLDRLVATFKVKQPIGYNGGLCQQGSTEYVAFWADWDDNCNWSYVGTASVPVHDIDPLPDGGLCYAAILNVDLTQQRRPCDEPRVVRVRAVLSWNVAPSTVDPDALTAWGDRIDSHVQIAPGPIVTGPTPLIGHLGGIPVSEIDATIGTTLPNAHFALLGGSVPADPDALGRACPFALRVAIQGPTFPGWQYRIQVKRAADINWATVNNGFTVSDQTGTIFTNQTAVGDYFTYLPNALNADGVLAEWDTTGDELWDVKIDILGIVGASTYRLQVHSSQPDVAIEIDVLAGNCGKFPVGTLLAGRFVARDDYFARYGLGTAPFAGPVVPAASFTETAPAPGDNWSLDTTNMTPCGYIVEVTAVSRTIYNSSPSYTSRTAAVGFCLEAIVA